MERALISAAFVAAGAAVEDIAVVEAGDDRADLMVVVLVVVTVKGNVIVDVVTAGAMVVSCRRLGNAEAALADGNIEKLKTW